jgi:4-carboxymuconolactone decarboxylase
MSGSDDPTSEPQDDTAMARVELITADRDLPADVRDVAERIVETRGAISRPFQVLLHSPAIAERVGELGHLVRSASSLSDADRELVTLATGSSLRCDFVWRSHLESARVAGVPEETVGALRAHRSPRDDRAATLISFVQELCQRGSVSASGYAAAEALLGTRALVDLVITVGYYTMLSRVMAAFEAC